MSVLDLQQASRRIHCPFWVIIAVGLWLALIGLIMLLAPVASSAPVLCNFKRFTGVPCPTCGTTRAAIALTRGDLIEAVALNPLTTIGILVLAGWLVLRIGFGFTLRWKHPSRRTRFMLYAASAALVGANWAFLILDGR